MALITIIKTDIIIFVYVRQLKSDNVKDKGNRFAVCSMRSLLRSKGFRLRVKLRQQQKR